MLMDDREREVMGQKWGLLTPEQKQAYIDAQAKKASDRSVAVDETKKPTPKDSVVVGDMRKFAPTPVPATPTKHERTIEERRETLTRLLEEKPIEERQKTVTKLQQERGIPSKAKTQPPEKKLHKSIVEDSEEESAEDDIITGFNQLYGFQETAADFQKEQAKKHTTQKSIEPSDSTPEGLAITMGVPDEGAAYTEHPETYKKDERKPLEATPINIQTGQPLSPEQQKKATEEREKITGINIEALKKAKHPIPTGDITKSIFYRAESLTDILRRARDVVADSPLLQPGLTEKYIAPVMAKDSPFGKVTSSYYSPSKGAKALMDIPTGFVKGAESLVNPNVKSAGGALVGTGISLATGKGKGQHIEQYIKDIEGREGELLGELIFDYVSAKAIGKGIEAARKTKVGGKILDPILKPLEKAEDFISKKVVQPVKRKIGEYSDDFVARVTGKTPQKVTGWERTGFGSKGYEFSEVTAPKKGGTSPFASTKPSVIVDDTGEHFITQTARATSKPVPVTSFEQTVYGKGGKPWVVITKHPPSPIGGGLSQLVDPSTLTRIPKPMIIGLKTKIAPRLFSATFLKPSTLGPAVLGFVSVETARGITTVSRPTPSIETITKDELITKTRTPPVQSTPIIPKSQQLVTLTPSQPTKQKKKSKTTIKQPQLPKQRKREIVVPVIGHLPKTVSVSIPKIIPDIIGKTDQVPSIAQIPTIAQIPVQKTAQTQKVIQATVQQQRTRQIQTQPTPIPSIVTGITPRIPYVPQHKLRKKKGKGDKYLFDKWRIKKHPVLTDEQVMKQMFGVKKTGKTKKRL